MQKNMFRFVFLVALMALASLLLAGCGGSPQEQAARELLDRYAAGERTFPNQDYSGADLAGAVLEYCDFGNSKFAGTNLSGATLNGSVFWEASLANADLSGAELNGTNMATANLSGANLSDSSVVGASFLDANLAGANLSGSGVSAEQLDSARSLQGAILPDGTRHE